MKIENFYLDGTIKNYLLYVPEKEKKGKKQKSDDEQSESLINESHSSYLLIFFVCF